MSTNCRTLDEMSEAEAIEYVKLLIERIKVRQVQQEAYLGHHQETPTDSMYRDSIMLDDAVLEVLNRLVATP